MYHPLFLLLPFVLAATRSLAFGVQPAGKSDPQSTISAETEYEILYFVIFSLTGLLASLYVMTRFPELGAIIAETDKF
jgi:hypothetical protein